MNRSAETGAAVEGSAKTRIEIPGMGALSTESGLVPLEACNDGRFRVGRDGVVSITATGDRKVEFIAFENHALAYVRSQMGYPAYYPVHPVRLEKPVKAVLMDLDGTSVRSEHFWSWIIQLSTASLLGDPGFELEEADLPFVQGHSVSEHLQYCIRKYCPDKTVEEARHHYFEHTRREMAAILEGRGRSDAFTPTPGLKEFLLELKAMKVKIGLVTSGLWRQPAWLWAASALTASAWAWPACCSRGSCSPISAWASTSTSSSSRGSSDSSFLSTPSASRWAPGLCRPCGARGCR